MIRRALPAAVGVLLLALAGVAGTARADGDPAKGKQKAIEICARCHVIGSHNPYGGIDSTPSFYIMSEKPQTYDQKLLSVTDRRPHRGIDLGEEVSPKDLENILSYVHTLERP